MRTSQYWKYLELGKELYLSEKRPVPWEKMPAHLRENWVAKALWDLKKSKK